MKSNWTISWLALSLLLTAGIALLAVFVGVPQPPVASQAPHLEPIPPLPSTHTKPLWRIPVPATANAPTLLAQGWVVTAGNGELLVLNRSGELRWRASYSNFMWQASSVVDDASFCAITQKGQLVLFHADTGKIIWTTDTQASCLYAPVVTSIDQQRVILLLSQEDGTLTCINAQDGTRRWISPATSRTDGPLLRFGDRLAYGNCDAAVYLFSLTNGHPIGSIQLADDEQVAGGILPLPDGTLLLGTRKGTLVMLDSARTTCVSRVSLSEAEAFATPTLVATNKILMPLSDGRMTFWSISENQLVAADVVTIASSFDETVVSDTVLWAIAGRTVYAIRTTKPAEQVTFMPGDALRALTPGRHGQAVLIADGDLICVKGF